MKTKFAPSKYSPKYPWLRYVPLGKTGWREYAIVRDVIRSIRKLTGVNK